MAATKLVRMTIVGASVLATSVAIDIGSASAQLEVPRVDVPQVQVPAAPVSPPALPSPPSVPQVELPALQVPVPDVQVPQVQVPGVPVPQAPSVPGVTAPGGTAPGSADAPASGDGSFAAPGTPGSAGSRSDSAGPPGERGRGGSFRAAVSSVPPGNPPVSSPSERALRREVGELAGCMVALPGFERRVLDLRTGLTDGPPSSRRVVARRLGVSLQRVRGAEREGLRQLRSSGCAGGGGSGLGIVWNDVMASVVTSPQLTTLASLDGAGAGDVEPEPVQVADRRAVLGDRESSRGSDGSGADEGAGAAGGTGESAGAGLTAASLGDAGGTPLLVWLLAGLAALAVLAATPLLLRRRSEGLAEPSAGVETAEPPVAGTAGAAATHIAEPATAATSETVDATPAPPPAAGGPTDAATGTEPPADRSAGTGRHVGRPGARAAGVAVSSAMSLAVGLAMWARRRSGGRRRR